MLMVWRRRFWALLESICGFFGIEIDNPYDDFMLYYGCPNSNKAEKLQLSRKSYK